MSDLQFHDVFLSSLRIPHFERVEFHICGIKIAMDSGPDQVIKDLVLCPFYIEFENDHVVQLMLRSDHL